MSHNFTPGLHFVGFRDPQQYANAVRVFGEPDFEHFIWDYRAKNEFVLDWDWDTVVFARYDFDQPSDFSYDDSNQLGDPAREERRS